jgi:hypothetical protein
MPATVREIRDLDRVRVRRSRRVRSVRVRQIDAVQAPVVCAMERLSASSSSLVRAFARGSRSATAGCGVLVYRPRCHDEGDHGLGRDPDPPTVVESGLPERRRRLTRLAAASTPAR